MCRTTCAIIIVISEIAHPDTSPLVYNSINIESCECNPHTEHKTPMGPCTGIKTVEYPWGWIRGCWEMTLNRFDFEFTIGPTYWICSHTSIIETKRKESSYLTKTTWMTFESRNQSVVGVIINIMLRKWSHIENPHDNHKPTQFL